MPNIPRATRDLNDVLMDLDSIIGEATEGYLSVDDLRDLRADLHGAMSWLL